ncbi:MAG: ComEC/Rec2 family competence protein [Opitutales bacterium]
MDYIRQSKIYKKLEVYRNVAPVFGYLIVMIFAFLLADSFGISASLRLCLYSLTFAFLILSFQYKNKIFAFATFFCLSLLYYDYRVDDTTPNLPTVDVNLTLRIDGINTTNDRYISTYATILDSPDFPLELNNKEAFLVIYGKGAKIDIGSKLKLLVSLTSIDAEDSGFDAFLVRRKISYKLVSNLENVKLLEVSGFTKTLQGIRQYISKSIENSSPKYERYLPMYRALIIGDMSKVAKADKQIFARSASIHIFAISGLHVGLVASLLFLIFRTLGIRYVLSIFITLALLYIYVQVCGAKPSAMRAYMMLLFVALAYVFKRKANSFNALLLSASIALIYEPKTLFNIGFLLSYCVVASIILYGLSLYDYLSKFYEPYDILSKKLLGFKEKATRNFYNYLVMSACISYSALIGGAFLCSYFFGYVAYSSVINFIIFIPLVSLILVLGFVALFMPSEVARILNDLILMILEFMTKIATFFSDSAFVIDIKIGSIYTLISALFILLATLIYLRDKRDLRLLYLPVSILVLVLLVC